MTPSLDYLAGILDVRGQLIIQDDGQGRRIPVMEVRSNEPELLQILADALGGKVTYYPARRWYYWKRTSLKCQEVLRLLRPFLIVRAAQADRMLSIPIKGRGKLRKDQIRAQARMGSQIATGV